MLAARAAPARRAAGARDRLVHDPADGARATPALGATAKAMVDLPRRSRNVLARRQRRTHIVVREHVAGTHNHGREESAKNGSI